MTPTVALARVGAPSGWGTRLEWYSTDEPNRCNVVIRRVNGAIRWFAVMEEEPLVPLLAFDDDLFDAEILLERMGIGTTLTLIELGMLLGSGTRAAARVRGERAKARAVIPPPAIPGKRIEGDRWTRTQAAELVVSKRIAVTA